MAPRCDYYGAVHCCGAWLYQSGKGGGPGHGEGKRHQKVLAFPAWRKTGCDVYFSSRWDRTCQIYDHYHTCRSLGTWWLTVPWDWVFIQELPYDLRTHKFDWSLLR